MQKIVVKYDIYLWNSNGIQ